MNHQPAPSESETSENIPSRISVLIFAVKANRLRLRRAVQNIRDSLPLLISGQPAEYPHLLATSRTPLWTETTLAERGLQQGKVHNLRIAVRMLQNVEVPADTTFSFWKQLGRATRRRGYAEGRQISEGCLIPAIGGGLCQLSNALYDAALTAGLEIVERHPHSRIVPGSAAEHGRDATVFWNYLDLRFRSSSPVLLTASLSAEILTVQIWGKTPRTVPRSTSQPIALTPRKTISIVEHSCGSCEADCFRRRPLVKASVCEEKTAFLVDRVTPEFAAYVRRVHQECDVLGIPLDGTKRGKPQYAWDTQGFARVECATWETLLRALRSRRLSGQGAARQQALLEAAEALARRYARLLTPDVTRVCVTQTLLPTLWTRGELGGRRFDVLMMRLPIAHLETALDEAFARHPESRTLHDFRAPRELRDAETQALAAADRIITPHPAIAALFPERAQLLPWAMPQPQSGTTGDALLFPYATLARKGAYAVRDAAHALNVPVRVMGENYEGETFWDGVKVSRVQPSENPFHGIRAVVAPAIIEDSPFRLLQAVSSGVPVLASPACGVSGLPGVVEIAPDDYDSLIAALKALLPC